MVTFLNTDMSLIWDRQVKVSEFVDSETVSEVPTSMRWAQDEYRTSPENFQVDHCSFIHAYHLLTAQMAVSSLTLERSRKAEWQVCWENKLRRTISSIHTGWLAKAWEGTHTTGLQTMKWQQWPGSILTSSVPYLQYTMLPATTQCEMVLVFQKWSGKTSQSQLLERRDMKKQEKAEAADSTTFPRTLF